MHTYRGKEKKKLSLDSLEVTLSIESEHGVRSNCVKLHNLGNWGVVEIQNM